MFNLYKYIIQLVKVIMIVQQMLSWVKGVSNDTTSKANTTHKNINEIIQLIKTINMKAIKCQVTVNALFLKWYCF